MKIDFATFCYSGDIHRLHAPGQLKKQVGSNDYQLDNVIVVYQNTTFRNRQLFGTIDYPIKQIEFNNFDIDKVLTDFNIKLDGQYQSSTDKHHNWKPHVANHLKAIQNTSADYIVFADNDCWIVTEPVISWIELGIKLLEGNNNIFIVSPNDGEPERLTQRMSQQMFLVKVDDFRNMDFNQPGWDGNVNIPGGPMPEYHAMLEGRIHHYCVANGFYRYVLGPEYRYFHHNRLTQDNLFDVDYKKLGWI